MNICPKCYEPQCCCPPVGDSNQHWAGCTCPQCAERAALRKRVEELEQELARGHNVGCNEALSEAQARAEKAERELDLRKRLMHGLPICGGCMGKHSECQACRADTLQADLDAALDWIEGVGGPMGRGGYPTDRVLALLEKRREENRG